MLLLFLAGSASAQGRRVEISPFGGYQFGGSSLSRIGQLEFEPDVSYGVMLDVRVRPDATIQFVYDRHDTILDFRDNDPFLPRQLRVDLAVEYYHLGGTVEFGEDRLRPYFGLTFGATRFDPSADGFSSEWRFSMGAGLGVKTYVSPRFGIRLDGRVWPSFVSTDGGFLCSLPGSCLVDISSDFVTQANVTGGFFVAF
ncbi:MAG: hypothetical protein ACRD21_27295 [Vicinamibacteria bacterium]